MNAFKFSGKNSVGKNINPSTIKYILIKFCRANPRKNTEDATLESYWKLFERVDE